MSEKVKEIIEMAKEFIDVAKRASELGFTTIYYNEVLIDKAETFKTLILDDYQSPTLTVMEEDFDYRYWYRTEVEGIKFLYITNEPLFFEGIDLEEVK